MSRNARKMILILLAAGTAVAVRAETAPLRKAPVEARCAPSYEDGHPNGYRCTQIEPGSLYDRLGLRNGDVIRAIDGESLSDPLTALEKLGRLSAPSRGKVSLLLEREGREISETLEPAAAATAPSNANVNVNAHASKQDRKKQVNQ